MAASSRALVLAVFVLLPHGSVGVSLHSEKSSETVIRREAKKPSRQVQLNANGDIETLAVQEKLDLGTQFCDYDFPLGVPGSDACITKGNHSLILEQSMCIEAGRRSGGKTDHAGFIIDQDDGDKHPKGCFKDACSATDPNVCYFYNGRDIPPSANSTLKGTVVCSRSMYLYGTPDTNDHCPEGYTIIKNEKQCLATTNCLGEAAAPVFQIGAANESKHLDFPEACFVDDTGLNGEGKGLSYYNPASNMTATAWGTHVKGTPICQVNLGERVLWLPGGAAGHTVAAGGNATDAGGNATM